MYDAIEPQISRDIYLEGSGLVLGDAYFGSYSVHPQAITMPSGKDASATSLRRPLPSEAFVGRSDELAQLERFFASDEPGRKIFRLMRTGGCGKSQLGFKFMYDRVLRDGRYNPSMVFFIDASTVTALKDSYAAIAQSKGLGSSAQDALDWLFDTRIPSFVLIDNADDPDIDLDSYVPRSTRARVLITTRLHEAGSKDPFINLGNAPRVDDSRFQPYRCSVENGKTSDAVYST
jgi:hypothetical protein